MVEPRQRLIGIKAPVGARWVKLSWADGTQQTLSTPVLRGYCPCARCQGHIGAIQFQTGHDEELRDLAPVGNYALRFEWGDGHNTGLYSFAYLRSLGDLVAEHGEQLPERVPTLPRH